MRLTGGAPDVAPPGGGVVVDARGRAPGAPVRGRRRRRRRTPVPWVRLVLLLTLGCWFAWASTSPGGVSARVNGFLEHVRGDVERATADPQLRRASDSLDAVFGRTGRYPQLSDAQLRDDPAYGIGVGVGVTICGPRSVVLVALTGRGTVTRLLVDGHMAGDIDGDRACPIDPDHPTPWHG